MSDELFDIEELGALIRKRRDARGMSLRDVAEAADVSFNTLSRVERGHIPDLRSFRKIVAWLGLDAGRFFESTRTRVESTPEVVAAHLRRDPFLPKEAAGRIAAIVEDLYRELARADETLAVHLRASSTFAPEAGELMASLLADIQAKLEEESAEDAAGLQS